MYGLLKVYTATQAVQPVNCGLNYKNSRLKKKINKPNSVDQNRYRANNFYSNKPALKPNS